MATLADELQNDFADSGSEGEEYREEDKDLSDAEQTNGKRRRLDNLKPKPEGWDSDVDGEWAAQPDAALSEDEDEQHGERAGSQSDNEMGDDSNGLLGEAPEETSFRLKAEKKDRSGTGDMRGVSSFMKSMEPVLEKIAYYQSLPADQQAKNEGLPEDNPEYRLLTKSNNFSTSIDDQAAEVHKYIRDHYSARFPELETLLGDPLEYTKTVAIIGNGPMDNIREISTSSDNIVGQALNAVLNRPKLMTVTVEATTTKGQELPEAELQAIRNACSTMLRLDQAKKTLTDFVQSRMNLFAPNLTRLVGSLTAAQLLNARGGLTALANTQASNIAAIGSKRPAHSGFATNVGIKRQGYLYESPIIMRFRPELRTQAMRIVSAKICLAARVDRVHDSPDGSIGEDLYEQCEKRLDKLIEPPPNKGRKALPAPDDKPAKKRGGRRARKAKEATMMTDLRKAQNRMAFGKEEQEVGYGTGEGTKGLGMIGQSNEGRIRALQVDQRTRAKLSKKTPGWGGATPAGGGAASSLRGFGQGGGGAGNASVLKGHGLRTSGVATSLGPAGTVSSLAFTPKQGLELVDPKARADIERKAKADEDRWFKGGTFTQVGGGGTASSALSGATPQNDGFKVPQLPVKRKADSKS